MAYDKKDRFFRKAKQESFVARSVYKLEEIDRRHQLFARGQRVVDLGCAPGSWLQYLARAVGPSGLVLGYDLVPVNTAAAPSVKSYALDVFALESAQIRADAGDDRPFDALISDMAPKLSGIRDADQARSVALAEKALSLALELLRPGGVFVAKLFQGRDTDDFLRSLREHFTEVKSLKPEATREGSREVFVVARGRKPPAHS